MDGQVFEGSGFLGFQGLSPRTLIFLFTYFGHTLPSCKEKGSKWQSGLNLGIFMFQAGFGNRSFWGIFDPIFSDTTYTGLESEIASFAGRKTGLIIPFWEADRRSDGLE